MKNSSKKFIKSEQKPSNKNATQKQTSTRPTKLPRRSSLNKLTTRTTTTRATRTTTSRPYKFRSSFLNSTQLLHLPLPLPSRNFSQPHVYSVTVIRRKSITTPAPESLIMVRDTAQQSNKTKDEKPPNIVYPPTGDTSELEDYDDDEEEDEDDVNTEDDKTKDSSEEAADEDQEVINASKSKENASSDVSSKVSQEVKVIPTPTTPAGDKGDKATIAVQADASKKKRKKKKKKKRRKKPEFHFVPAPLGPKADLMIRLDKVHHNVKNIVSVVKGVFTDYVVNRPYVNVELYKGIHAYTYKMGLTPPVNIKYERSNIQPLSQTHTVPYLNPFRNNNAELFSWPSKYPGADLRTKSHQQPLEGSSVENSYQISKRILEEDCADDITCEGEVRRVVPKKLKRPKSKPRPTGRHGHNQVKKNSPLTLPYPIYIESMYDDSNENDPFKHLPPMRPNQFMKAEKNWVKTWDKKTGLPPIAGANEASMHSKRRKGSKKSRRKKKKRGKEQ
ncbi:uncharacterized protein LOC110853937 isoform X2 [Folsomia candida]|nr:uncharacterized protein LOC110853937 isoform X2 [Folsomia candida]